MWDPTETWTRDDDVLSWRSLDTLRGAETDRHILHPLHDTLDDSDMSDPEELAEIIDKRAVGGAMTTHRSAVRMPWMSGGTSAQQTYHIEEPPVADEPHMVQLLCPDLSFAQFSLDATDVLRELPSTSEMVRIHELIPAYGRGSEAVIPREFSGANYGDNSSSRPQRMGEDSSMKQDETFTQFKQSPPRPTPTVESIPDRLQRSTVQDNLQRVTMTLADLLAKRNDDSSMLPPPPPLPPTLTPMVPNDKCSRVQEMKELQRQCDQLAEKERHLQTLLAKQLHQIEAMSEQMHEQDSKFQAQQLELSGLKEQLVRLERQNVSLQSSVREKEQTLEQHTKLVLQKTNDLTALETKLRSLQITNESFQEQARKATEDKDKVHKDYLQVVYDLSKLQKQMNANAKETVNAAEKDLLLREIEQLRHEKDQLVARLKESEARKSSLLQNNAAVEAQRMRDLQARVRELEEDLNRARYGRPSQNGPSAAVNYSTVLAPSSQPVYRQSVQPQSSIENSHQSYQPPMNQRQQRSWSPPDESGMPSLVSSMNSSVGGSTKSMTLKDMMADRRPPAPAPLASSMTGLSSLASLGYSAPDRRSSGFDFEQNKADALARRSGDGVLRPSSTSYDPSADPALSAPFATEKQTLLQDSLQKRDLEQKLLKLHVEKEQMEAKLIKVEQTGLKTMSARTEKVWLESRLRDLTLEVSRLKLSLR